jgi:NAD(P)-dependent dehydrogenase (short-subunit alcohol dehydrogenase family)
LELQNKIIAITGAGSGIGRALAVRFHAEGAKKIIAVDINLGDAQDTADRVNGVAMIADVANENDISRVIEEIESSVGAIDLFCSNAGVAIGESIDSVNSEWQASWDINVMSHVRRFSRYLSPKLVFMPPYLISLFLCWLGLKPLPLLVTNFSCFHSNVLDV